MNQDEIKTMMRSFERLNSKTLKSVQNKMTLDDMWHKMPQIVQHQITVIKEYQEAYVQQANKITALEDLASESKLVKEIYELRDLVKAQAAENQQQAEQIEQAKADNRLLSVGKEVEKTKAENIYEDWCELVDKHKQQAEQITAIKAEVNRLRTIVDNESNMPLKQEKAYSKDCKKQLAGTRAIVEQQAEQIRVLNKKYEMLKQILMHRVGLQNALVEIETIDNAVV